MIVRDILIDFRDSRLTPNERWFKEVLKKVDFLKRKKVIRKYSLSVYTDTLESECSKITIDEEFYGVRLKVEFNDFENYWDGQLDRIYATLYFEEEKIEVSYRLNDFMDFIKLLISLYENGKGFYNKYKDTLIPYDDFYESGYYVSHPFLFPGTYREMK